MRKPRPKYEMPSSDLPQRQSASTCLCGTALVYIVQEMDKNSWTSSSTFSKGPTKIIDHLIFPTSLVSSNMVCLHRAAETCKWYRLRMTSCKEKKQRLKRMA